MLHAGERAIGADRDGAQIVVIADAGHDKILAFGGGFRRRRGLVRRISRPIAFALAGGPVVHRDLVTAFGDEMSCHGETHNAETEKSDFGHVCNPGVSAGVLIEPGMIVERDGGWLGARNRLRRKGGDPRP